MLDGPQEDEISIILRILYKNNNILFIWLPLRFHTPSIQHIGSTQKGHSFSAPKIPQFHTPLSFTHDPLRDIYQNMLSLIKIYFN